MVSSLNVLQQHIRSKIKFVVSQGLRQAILNLVRRS